MAHYNPLAKYTVTHDMIRAMVKFHQAASELSEKWDLVDGNSPTITELYPFKDSFDELVLKIGDWVDGALRATVPEKED